MAVFDQIKWDRRYVPCPIKLVIVLFEFFDVFFKVFY